MLRLTESEQTAEEEAYHETDLKGRVYLLPQRVDPPLQSFSQAEMISSCTNIRPIKLSLYRIRNITQGQTPIGKYRLLNGRPFFIALNRANRSEKLQGIMTSRVKRSGVCCGPLVAGKWDA
jgi:hypothetical protein